ncbi:MAG: type I restriction enzyme HsdR N-terminal domain-containing protein [Lentimicrobiaceae bacterium]|nr:type I restriction enzyme HsdR N-terminal domain-containing protein [Lentimicrobiaceae bacterium]
MLKIRNYNGAEQVFDPVRKKWVAFTEEEKVRQFFILRLINELKIPASHISIERKITLNGLTKRYDIVVYKTAVPWMVVECKAPHIPLTQEVIEQAGRYNQTLNAEIIGVTNGAEERFFKIDFEAGDITSVTL